ncbi:clamp loader subunit DNA polymerase accessory protein [Salmonella phage 37]|uniref:Clamp loader subunit DNA polymerase accessory protein n=1 Tax=Salmonella phage 37 TaxID=1654890 RepID=A0A0N7CDW3_9CAUD|nr:clamp loader of DNA polymerase [Salmonella phage 37]AKJ73957.1 clamp loader subunit DNA polymerase accessory protein [Salmonella phage 37]
MALFTHSYYHGSGAQLNPAAAYISDAKVLHGKGFSEFHTTENGDRYVFSFWLAVGADLLVAVKPSDEMIAAWKASHGGLLTALMPRVQSGGEKRTLYRINAGIVEQVRFFVASRRRGC